MELLRTSWWMCSIFNCLHFGNIILPFQSTYILWQAKMSWLECTKVKGEEWQRGRWKMERKIDRRWKTCPYWDLQGSVSEVPVWIERDDVCMSQTHEDPHRRGTMALDLLCRKLEDTDENRTPTHRLRVLHPSSSATQLPRKQTHSHARSSVMQPRRYTYTCTPMVWVFWKGGVLIIISH